MILYRSDKSLNPLGMDGNDQTRSYGEERISYPKVDGKDLISQGSLIVAV
jgi:hypothetical protein